TAARASATMPPGLPHAPPSTTRKHPADRPVRTSEVGIGGRERDGAYHRADRIGMNASGGTRVGDQPIDELAHTSTSTCPRLPPQPEKIFLLERDGDGLSAHTMAPPSEGQPLEVIPLNGDPVGRGFPVRDVQRPHGSAAP